MTIAVPSYRLNGELRHTHEEPSLASVCYHRQLRNLFYRENWRSFPQHAREAIRQYSDTLHDLAAAGF